MSMSFFHRAEFHELAKIFGVNPLQIEKQVQQENPSPVIAQSFYTQIAVDAMWIEKVFISIYRKLYTLKQWERQGIIDIDRLDQSKEWFDLRMRALPLLLWRYGLLDEQFEDGSGI